MLAMVELNVSNIVRLLVVKISIFSKLGVPIVYQAYELSILDVSLRKLVTGVRVMALNHQASLMEACVFKAEFGDDHKSRLTPYFLLLQEIYVFRI